MAVLDFLSSLHVIKAFMNRYLSYLSPITVKSPILLKKAYENMREVSALVPIMQCNLYRQIMLTCQDQCCVYGFWDSVQPE